MINVFINKESIKVLCIFLEERKFDSTDIKNKVETLKPGDLVCSYAPFKFFYTNDPTPPSTGSSKE